MVLLVSNVSCKNKDGFTKVQRGFYYWKSGNSYLSEGETKILKSIEAQKLYIKFFEVEKDPLFNAKPIAKSELRMWDYGNSYQAKEDSLLSKIMSNLDLIPTIFIKNEVFKNASNGSLDTLADNINFLVNKYYKDKFKFQKPFQEIQIDCDWTAKTKEHYFYLLRKLKKISAKTISCTLRLYPYKYPAAMGVPPVDKATLMCYNLISSLDNENKNAILDNTEFESYLKNAPKYPLHLDIALPVFSWMLVYQNNSFAGMVNPNEGDLKDAIKQVKPMWYQVEKDVVVGNMYLREGDKIKYEEVTEKSIKEAIELIRKYVTLDENTTITLFHLDIDNLTKYQHETIRSFYAAFDR